MLNDNNRVVGFAHKLLVHDYEVPEGWNHDVVQRALSWRPILSDLVFNYLDAAMRADRQTSKEAGKADGEIVDETELAFDILVDLINGILRVLPEGGEIRVDDIAYHFCTRI